jgi:peroxiredoxin
MIFNNTKTESSIELEVGTEAPDFTAPLVRPERETEPVALSTLLEDSPVLLAFYTNDFSPDCVTEWCSFRDDAWFDASDEVQVVGVSRSRPFTHRRFMEQLDLSFPLYSDTDLAITEAYGVRYRLFKLLPRARRSCFLIDQEGKIRYTWVAEHPIDATRDTPSMHEIRAAIEEELNGLHSISDEPAD